MHHKHIAGLAIAVVAMVGWVSAAAKANGNSSNGCGCSDEPGSACWTTWAKRNANCKSKGWLDQNYCSRIKDSCGLAYCHCCGSKLNSGCEPQSDDEAKGYAQEKDDWRCYKTPSERDKNCGSDHPKRCQGRREFNDSGNWIIRMTYCCGKSAWPPLC